MAALAAELRPGDRVAILSNGGFGGIHEKLLQALGEVHEANGRPRKRPAAVFRALPPDELERAGVPRRTAPLWKARSDVCYKSPAFTQRMLPSVRRP